MNFFNQAKKRFSIGGGVRTESSSPITETESSTYTTTTTTTFTRYENGVPVEVITKTSTSNSSNEPNSIETHDEIAKPPIGEPEVVEKPVEKIEVVEPVEKPEEKPDKKTDEPDEPKIDDPDEPEIDDSVVSHQGERTDPVSRCSPIVDIDEFKGHLDLTGYDFSKVDEYARETPEAETESSTRLSKYLTSPWDESLDKLRCIFVWIAENISYDTDAFFGGNIQIHGPDDVLRMRKAVCDGYSKLFDKLASEAGLKVWRISGKSKGAGFTPGCDIDSPQFDHAWNGVLYKGEYLLIDNTWGAGHLNGMDFEKHLEPFYFLCSPTQFIYGHLPEKPEHQYIEPKLNKKEFLDLPYVKPKFFTSGLSFVKHLGNSIEVSDDNVAFEVERIHPDETKPIHAVLEWEGQDLPVMVQRLGTPGPRGGRKYKLLCTCPSKGEGDLNIFVLLEGNSGPMVSSFKVKNSGCGENFATSVNTFSVPFSYTIHNPIRANLKYNDHVKFEITIFDKLESELPSLAMFSPEKTVRDLQKVSSTEDSTTFAIETCVDQKGEWGLTCREPDSNSFSFIAKYVVE